MTHTTNTTLTTLAEDYGFDPPRRITSLLHHPQYVWKLRQRGFNIGRGGARYLTADYVLTTQGSKADNVMKGLMLMTFCIEKAEFNLGTHVLKEQRAYHSMARIVPTKDPMQVHPEPTRKVYDPDNNIITPEDLAHYVEINLTMGLDKG
jgi:hypothetical protein